jgi:hypothetical protein
MVVDQSVRKNLNINPNFFFFYDSFVNKSTGLDVTIKFFNNLQIFRWFFFLRLKLIFNLYLTTLKRFERVTNAFSWINSKKTIRFYNEGGYRSGCSSFKIFKLYTFRISDGAHGLSKSAYNWDLWVTKFNCFLHIWQYKKFYSSLYLVIKFLKY